MKVLRKAATNLQKSLIPVSCVYFLFPVENQLLQIELTNYFKLFFDAVYILCCCPFRLKLIFNNTRESFPTFEIASCWPQKVLCTFFTVLNSLWVFRELSSSFFITGKPPLSIFLAVLRIVNCLGKFVVIKEFWLHQKAFCDLLNYIVSKDGHDIPIKRGVYLNKIVVVGILLLFTSITFLDVISCRGMILTSLSDSGPHISQWSFSWWWETIKQEGYLNALLATKNWKVAGNYTRKLTNRDYHWDVFLGVLSVVGWCHRKIFGGYCEALQLTAAFTLWTAACGFSSFLNLSSLSCNESSLASVKKHTFIIHMESPEVVSWANVMRKYEAIKKLMKLINSTLGTNFTIFLVIGILDYAISFDETFVEGIPDWSKYLGVAFYFLNSCGVRILCAEVCRQMETLKEWMSKEENRRQIPLDQLYLITNELDTHCVAIKGSGIFPITYSLVANMAGITVTYFIICVQA